MPTESRKTLRGVLALLLVVAGCESGVSPPSLLPASSRPPIHWKSLKPASSDLPSGTALLGWPAGPVSIMQETTLAQILRSAHFRVEGKLGVEANALVTRVLSSLGRRSIEIGLMSTEQNSVSRESFSFLILDGRRVVILAPASSAAGLFPLAQCDDSSLATDLALSLQANATQDRVRSHYALGTPTTVARFVEAQLAHATREVDLLLNAIDDRSAELVDRLVDRGITVKGVSFMSDQARGRNAPSSLIRMRPGHRMDGEPSLFVIDQNRVVLHVPARQADPSRAARDDHFPPQDLALVLFGPQAVEQANRHIERATGQAATRIAHRLEQSTR